jgi:hypothetical protein
MQTPKQQRAITTMGTRHMQNKKITTTTRATALLQQQQQQQRNFIAVDPDILFNVCMGVGVCGVAGLIIRRQRQALPKVEPNLSKRHAEVEWRIATERAVRAELEANPPLSIEYSVEQLGELFDSHDTNKNRRLDEREATVLARLYIDAVRESVLDAVDGAVTRLCSAVGMLEKRDALAASITSVLDAAFDSQVHASPLLKRFVRDFCIAADTNHDGRVSRDEFIDAMRSVHELAQDAVHGSFRDASVEFIHKPTLKST